jgi:hypothetical protein
VQSRRSLCANVVGEAWRAAGTGLRRAMCRRSWVMRCSGSARPAAGVSSSPGMRRGSPYTMSATDACRSALYEVRIPRRTSGSASVHCWSSWHMMAAFNVRWKRSTRGCWVVGGCPGELGSTHPGQGAEELRLELTSLVRGDSLRATETGYVAGNEGTCHDLGCDVRDWEMLGEAPRGRRGRAGNGLQAARILPLE